MNEKEKREFYTATCRCCLIADAMKTCRLCRFKIGLAEQEKPVVLISISLPTPAQLTIFAMSE